MKRRMAWEGLAKSIPGETANLQDPENEGGVIWKQEAHYILAEITGFKPQLCQLLKVCPSASYLACHASLSASVAWKP